MTLDSHTAANLTLLAALYFVIGQALAHPIIVNITERKKLSRDTRIRLGIVFGVAWPLLVAGLLSVIAAKGAKSESRDGGSKGVAHERAVDERAANERAANERAVTEGDEPARRDEA